MRQKLLYVVGICTLFVSFVSSCTRAFVPYGVHSVGPFGCLIACLLGVFAARKSASAPALLPALLAAANPVACAGADPAKAPTVLCRTKKRHDQTVSRFEIGNIGCRIWKLFLYGSFDSRNRMKQY